MTRMLDLDRELADWLQASGPADIDPSVVDGAFAIARRARQRRGLALTLAGPWPWPADQYPRRRLAGLGAGVLTLTVLALGLALVPKATGPGATPRPTETLPPTGKPISTRGVDFFRSPDPPPTGVAIPIDQLTGLADLPGHQLLAGSPFGAPMTFWLDYFGDDPANAPSSDWCQASVSPRQLVLPYKMGCVADVRILRPSAVRCGTTSEQPGVDELALAILRNPGLAAEDLGPVAGNGWLPPGLFAGPAPSGRVIQVDGTRLGWRTDPTQAYPENPENCEFLADQPTVEVRGDLPVVLILLEVRGELVIVDLSSGGHDAASMQAARTRGYGGTTAVGNFDSIHDISFEAPQPTETLASTGKAAPQSVVNGWPSVGSAPTGPAVPIGLAGDSRGLPAVRLLSASTFDVPVTLWLDVSRVPDMAPLSAWGPATTSPRQIVLPSDSGGSEVRILQPTAVRCGTTTDQPGVDELTLAILRNPGLNAQDMGPVAGNGWLPPRLFADPAPPGRVILVSGTRLGSRPTGGASYPTNPDGCVIVADQPTVEVRGDLTVLLILLDVGGELVIVDVSGGGYDGPSIQAARARGFDYYDSTVLQTIHDLSFGTGGAQ